MNIMKILEGVFFFIVSPFLILGSVVIVYFAIVIRLLIEIFLGIVYLVKLLAKYLHLTQ